MDTPYDPALWRKCLETDGYCVIPNFLTEEECTQHIQQLWTFVEGVSPTAKREQPETWRKDWPIGQHGLIQHYGVGWNAASRELRLKLLPLMQAFWGTTELHCSYDAINFTRPPSVSSKGSPRYFSSQKDWSHFDQDGRLLGLQNVQASINLIDQDQDDACFICWPKSWKYHPDIVPKATNLGHWYKLQDKDYATLRAAGLDPIRVPVPAGHVILWRSDLAHAGAPALATRKDHSRWRAVVFACYQPADRTEITEKTRLQRSKAFAEQRTSTHTGRNFPKHPRTYGNPDACHTFSGEVSPLSCEERLLYGLDAYPVVITKGSKRPRSSSVSQEVLMEN